MIIGQSMGGYVRQAYAQQFPEKWIKGAGHNSNTDAPETVNQLLADFLSRI